MLPLLATLVLLSPQAAEQTREESAPHVVVASHFRQAFTSGETAHFLELGDPTLQAALPAMRLNRTFKDMQAKVGENWRVELDPADWKIDEPWHLMHVKGEAGEIVVRFALDHEGQMTGLYYNDVAKNVPASRLDEASDNWQGEWAFTLMRLPADGGEPKVWTKRNGRQAYPLASIFKVYVLAELSRQIAAGDRRWEDEIELTEDIKSLPSGITHNEAAGTLYSIEKLTNRMIGISDNTATDMLLHDLGADKVEAILPTAFNSVPERNRPFLSTMEMFKLKSTEQGASATDGDRRALIEAWDEGTPEDRRAIVKKMNAAFGDMSPGKVRSMTVMGYQLGTLGEKNHYDIEWIAAPEDIAALYAAAACDEFIDAKASAAFRKGMAAGAGTYWGPRLDYEGFKGGNETGVLTLSGLLRDTDGNVVIACVFRCGFPPLDIKLTERTVNFYNALLRIGMEDRLPE